MGSAVKAEKLMALTPDAKHGETALQGLRIVEFTLRLALDNEGYPDKFADAVTEMIGREGALDVGRATLAIANTCEMLNRAAFLYALADGEIGASE